MCLEIRLHHNTDKQEFLESHKGPFYAYKLVLSKGRKSVIKGFDWKKGENISDRESTDLTVSETEMLEVYKGFHLAVEKPKCCDFLCDHYRSIGAKYADMCDMHGMYVCRKRENVVLKCLICPEDIVAVGVYGGIKSLVATKAFVESEE